MDTNPTPPTPFAITQWQKYLANIPVNHPGQQVV